MKKKPKVNVHEDSPENLYLAKTTLVFNAGLVREESLDEIDYWVFPAVMMKEAVLNGSHGALFYPGEEIAKTQEAWDHKPLLVEHPFTTNAKGEKVTSLSTNKNVLTRQKIGFIMNTSYDESDRKLKTECWADKKKVAKHPKVHAILSTGEGMLEVSTGVYTDDIPINNAEGSATAEYEGKRYEATAVNYRPDHLALLPDQKGACSIADGAGGPRLNSEGGVVENVLSFDDTREQLRKALKAICGDKWVYIQDIFPGTVVYSLDGTSGETESYRIGYAVGTDDAITLSAEKPVKVVRKTSYEAVTNTATKKEPQPMKIADIQKALADGEITANELATLTPAPAAKVAPAANAETEEAPKRVVVRKTAKANALSIIDDSDLSDAEKARAKAAITNADKDRKELIGKLVANTEVPFSADELDDMADDKLQKLDAKFNAKPVEPAKPAPAAEGTVDYSGQGELPTKNAEKDPTFNGLETPSCEALFASAK